MGFILHSASVMLYMTEPSTEELLSCYKVKGFSWLFVCFSSIFCRVMTFIRYIGIDFTFGLLDCVRYNEDFVILRFVKSRFCPIHVTVLNFGRGKEYRSFYRGLRYIEVR